jgi:aminopeptidase N
VTQGTSTQAREIRRVDYRPPDFWIERVELVFQLERDRTRVRARLSGRRNEAVNSGRRPLVLSGEGLELHALRLNGSDLVIGEFEVTEESLTIPEVPERFELGPRSRSSRAPTRVSRACTSRASSSARSARPRASGASPTSSTGQT